jgi:hypothetical protein
LRIRHCHYNMRGNCTLLKRSGTRDEHDTSLRISTRADRAQTALVALTAPTGAAVEAGVTMIVDVAEGAGAIVAQEAEVVDLRKLTSVIGEESWTIGPENVVQRPSKTKPIRSMMKRHLSWC